MDNERVMEYDEPISDYFACCVLVSGPTRSSGTMHHLREMETKIKYGLEIRLSKMQICRQTEGKQ